MLFNTSGSQQTRRRPNVILMFARRGKRRANIKTVLDQHLMFAEFAPWRICKAKTL